jgi:hypothetical protein
VFDSERAIGSRHAADLERIEQAMPAEAERESANQGLCGRSQERAEQ